MHLNIVFLRPKNWSRLKPYYSSTIATIKALFLWVECTIGILADFRPNHLFSEGTKAPFPNDHFDNPESGHPRLSSRGWLQCNTMESNGNQ